MPLFQKASSGEVRLVATRSDDPSAIVLVAFGVSDFDINADTLVVAELAVPVNVAKVVEGEVAVL
jgi:hypothetical protein